MAVALLTALVAAPVVAQTGVSDDRVVLPDGPGSIDGLGDNIAVDANMGAMTYEVPIEVPEGFEGMTPDLSLRYGSTAGASVVGVGWWMPSPSIERLTLYGLPRYQADDAMAADGTEQLVRVARATGRSTYRARFERAFVRYTWHDGTGGRGGYWTAEWPDGRVGYYGADARGTAAPEARLERGGETFRWMLVETVDPFGHRVRYGYDASSGTPLLSTVEWVHRADGAARYRVELEHEDRPDPISDASPGFEERLTRRLAVVRVRVGGEVIRTYRLRYEDEATSGGVSRLARVERFGRSGGRYPVVHAFAYSRSLSGVCGAGSARTDCDRPFVVDMGSIPGAGNLGRGDATLIDIDGDALPDLLDTSLERHRFYLNRLDGSGQARFEPAPTESALGRRTPFALAQASVQVLDVNGDGFADLVDVLGGRFLCNLGRGDWVDPRDVRYREACGAVAPLTGATLELDGVDGSGDPDPARTRFVDLDGDRRIDILRTDSATEVRGWINTAEGFRELGGLEPLGAQFDGQAVQLADMNGDGLLDAVWIDAAGTVLYRLHYGRGRFSRESDARAWRVAEAPPFGSTTAVALTQLEDLNGDGLDDLVLVEGSTVSFAINRNVGRFDAWRRITVADVAELPVRLDTTTVLFADMNGTGSRDVVWVEQSGRVRYLELFPVRPNLLARVENGLGLVQVVTYGRSVAHRAASTQPWRHPLPHPMSVVDQTDTWVTLTGDEDGAGLHEVVDYTYRDGFYDGIEKRFRGYGEVEQRVRADDARDGQEPSRTAETYDVGDVDPYRAGLLLTRASFSGAPERALREERFTHADCEVAEAEATGPFPVRHLCETEALVVHQEGAPTEEWVTTRIETSYDGYGNAVRVVEHGVVHRGPPEAPRVCEPCRARPADTFGEACDATCLGDERYVEREHVVPGSATDERWILRAVHTERAYASPGGPASQTRTYYDGPDFVGLELGRLARGRATRVMQRASADAELAIERSALDAHGNAIVSLDPLGDPSDASGHRRHFTYDEHGLRVVRTEVHVSRADEAPYRLRQEYAYEPAFDRVIESSGWMIDGAGVSSARNPTYYRYDEHARLVGIVRPGDTSEAPSLEVSWELGDPASRVVVRRRAEAGETPSIETARCIDGAGRLYQELTRVREGEWLASGFVEHNRRGSAVRTYQPYTVASGRCATRAPEGVHYVDVRYDGAGREMARTLPDEALHGSRSELRREYLPLGERVFDENDFDLTSPQADTPELARQDGLGRTISVERTSRGPRGLETAITTLFYDALGNAAGFVDAEGQLKRQHHDLAGRIVRVEDPSTGVTRFEHDAAGNVIARTDARGVTTRTEHDGANRPIARYDERDPIGTRITLRYDFAPDCAWPACANAEGRLVETRFPVHPEVVARLDGEPWGADRIGYDARGRAVREELRLGAAVLVTEHTFDGADRPVETRYPDGQVLRRQFDDAGRLVAIDGRIERVEYGDAGLLARVVRADGSDEVVRHDALLRLAGRTSVAGDGTVLQDVSFARDRRGQIIEEVDATPALGALSTGTSRYAYDGLQRMIEARVAEGLAQEEQLTYAFARVDRLLAATSSRASESAAHVGAYGYDPARPSIAVQVGERTQRHDAAGFLVEREGQELEWDFLGRLTRTAEDGETAATFVYGGGARRVAKIEEGALTVYVGADFEIRDGVSRVYARMGRDRVTRSQSTALATTLYGDPDGDGAITAADGLFEPDATRRLALLRASARRTLHDAAPESTQLYADHLGSLVGATREGRVVGLRRHHPYGEVRGAQGFVDERSFTGQERDASTGLLAFEWRYLDTRSGLWASADPAFERINQPALSREYAGRYVYVSYNPINAIDPTGLMQQATTGAPAQSNAQRPSFDELMQAVPSLNFETPVHGAVFWSGEQNMPIAQQWAGGVRRMTLEQTEGGNYLNNLRLFDAGSGLSGQQAAQVWDAASARFAELATGEVNVFAQGTDRIGKYGERTWYRLERPQLMRRGRTTINERTSTPRRRVLRTELTGGDVSRTNSSRAFRMAPGQRTR